jgi:hypothetical protein
MDPGERRQQSFFEHLSDSEKRLGARRHSVLDALVMGAIAVIIVGGLTLGIVRLRTLARIDQPNRFDTAAPVSPSVSASPASQAGSEDKAVSRPAPSRVQTGKDQGPDSTPTPGQPGKDERPYIDVSKPGKYTIRDSKVEVEINTLSERDRDAKLEQLKKEGLLTEKEAEELKKQKRSP